MTDVLRYITITMRFKNYCESHDYKLQFYDCNQLWAVAINDYNAIELRMNSITYKITEELVKPL